VDLLPWLAWACSVDIWDDDWPEDTRRRVIADSYSVHSVKGTVGAVKRALAALGAEAELVEWFNQLPPAAPYTFALTTFAQPYTASALALDATGQRQVIDTVWRAKNVRSHPTIRMGGSFGAGLGLASSATAGSRLVASGTGAVSWAGAAGLTLAGATLSAARLSASGVGRLRDTAVALLGLAAPVHAAPRSWTRARGRTRDTAIASLGLAASTHAAPRAVIRLREA